MLKNILKKDLKISSVSHSFIQPLLSPLEFHQIVDNCPRGVYRREGISPFPESLRQKYNAFFSECNIIFNMKTICVRLLSLEEVKKKEESLLSSLDQERVKKALSYQREENKLQSLGAGYFIKKYTNPDETIFYNEYQKPCKKNEHFNLSHSFDYVAFLSFDRECGIDIEKIREGKERLKSYAFSSFEQEQIHSDSDFYQFWTRKEALGKAYGNGLSEESLKKIPSEEGILSYHDKIFTLKTILFSSYVISIALEGEEEELKIVVKEERIDL